MLGRRAVLDTLCLRCQALYGISTPRPAVLPLLARRRSFHSTQNPRGLLAWLVGDNRRAKVHKEIGNMLGDYDDKLTQLYDETVEAYTKAYMTGARADQIKMFEQVAVLYRFKSHMEQFVTTNEFLKQTALSKVIHEGEIQKKATTLIEAMTWKYGADAQFKYYLEEEKNRKYEPTTSFEKPMKNAKVAGMFTKMYNYIRDHELEVLRGEYEKAQAQFEDARSTGRRRDINRALKAALDLEIILEERYDGLLWRQEEIAGDIDPRLKRTDENIAQLEELKANIRVCISSIREEFSEASKSEDEKVEEEK